MAEMYGDTAAMEEVAYRLMLMCDADDGRFGTILERIRTMVEIVERNGSLVRYGYKDGLEGVAETLDACQTHLSGYGIAISRLAIKYAETEKKLLESPKRSTMKPWEVDELVGGMLAEEERLDRERAEAERDRLRYKSVEEYENSRWFHIDKSTSHFTGLCAGDQNRIDGSSSKQGKLGGSCLDMQGTLVVFPENDYFNIRINHGYQAIGGGLGINLEGDERSSTDSDWGGADADFTGISYRAGIGLQFGSTKVDAIGSVGLGAGVNVEGSSQRHKTGEETASFAIGGGVFGKFGGTLNITRPSSGK